jgi:hypothetical protein
VMEMLRIVDDGIGGSSGGEVVAVVGLPFTGSGWAWISLDGRYGLGMCCTLWLGPGSSSDHRRYFLSMISSQICIRDWFVPKCTNVEGKELPN